MNGKMAPLARATAIMPALGDFIDKYTKRGFSPVEAQVSYDYLSRCEKWKNDEYQVLVDKTPPHGLAKLAIWYLSIKRLDKKPIHDWRDLQTIKNMIAGPQFEAVELYPAEDRLVDTSNQYHLYVLMEIDGSPVQFPVGWTTRLVTGAAEAKSVGARQRGL